MTGIPAATPEQYRELAQWIASLPPTPQPGKGRFAGEASLKYSDDEERDDHGRWEGDASHQAEHEHIGLSRNIRETVARTFHHWEDTHGGVVDRADPESFHQTEEAHAAAHHEKGRFGLEASTTLLRVKYSADQPRDDHGRFADGDGEQTGRITLYRGEGNHDAPSPYYPTSGPDALAGAWYTTNLDSAQRYAAGRPDGRVYKLDVAASEAEPHGLPGYYLVPDPEVRARREPYGELPDTATVGKAWAALNADRFNEDEQQRVHPENYEPNRGFDVHLKEGATEWHRGVDATGVPTIFQVQGKDWRTMTLDEKRSVPGAMMPMDAPDGTPVGVVKVPGSERPEPFVYRVMSTAEFDQAKERGYFQSDQNMNLADEGTVASRRSTGSFYMPMRSDANGEQTGEHADARIVQFNMNPADGWKVDTDGYVKTHGQIPFSRIAAYSEPIKQRQKSSSEPSDTGLPNSERPIPLRTKEVPWDV